MVRETSMFYTSAKTVIPLANMVEGPEGQSFDSTIMLTAPYMGARAMDTQSDVEDGGWELQPKHTMDFQMRFQPGDGTNLFYESHSDQAVPLGSFA
jgi:hypothetical protein